MNFGQAIEALKHGKLVAREGWNGKGMSLVLIKVTGLEARTLPENIGVRPCIAMRDAQGMLVPGWLASQTDMLAEDWVILD